jgi:hypothetical protein
VIDPAALQLVLGVFTGWLERRERKAVAYLIEENRLGSSCVSTGSRSHPSTCEPEWYES